MYQERQGYVGGGGGSPPPHGVILAVVVVIIVLGPFIIGDQGAITESITQILTPLGLLLLPILLLLTIQFLSSDRGGSFVSKIFSTGQPDTIHRVSGSPFGVALFLVLIVFLLYNRVSLFGGGGDGSE